MSYKTRLATLKKPVSRLLAAVAGAVLFMPGAEALTVSSSGGDTIYIDFVDAYDIYVNELYVDEGDANNPNSLPFLFDLTVSGEYYTPTSEPGSESVALVPPTWTPVYHASPNANQVGVYNGFMNGPGLGLTSSVNDEFNDLDGCQDYDCTLLDSLRWEALRFTFSEPVRLTVIGFSAVDPLGSDDFNLTVINGATTTHPYRDVVPPDGLLTLSESQVGTDFRIWVDYEDDDFFITGIKFQAVPNNGDPGDLAPRGAPDGVLDAADVLILTRLVTGAITATPVELVVGDLNANDELDAGDLVLLQTTVLGPIPPP